MSFPSSLGRAEENFQFFQRSQSKEAKQTRASGSGGGSQHTSEPFHAGSCPLVFVPSPCAWAGAFPEKRVCVCLGLGCFLGNPDQAIPHLLIFVLKFLLDEVIKVVLFSLCNCFPEHFHDHLFLERLQFQLYPPELFNGEVIFFLSRWKDFFKN